MSSYPTRPFRRTAFAPAILATIVLLAGLALIQSSAFIWIRWPVSILALIVLVFAWQARHWWWAIPMAAIAVVWNPVFPLTPHPLQLWLGLQYGAAIIFIAAGVLIKVRNEDDRNSRPNQAGRPNQPGRSSQSGRPNRSGASNQSRSSNRSGRPNPPRGG